MTIYIKEKNTVECLDAREVAPKNANENMFQNKSSLEGGLSIAVPSELKGLWELHQKYGKLPWKELFAPVIKLCREGHEVTDYLAKVLRVKETSIKEIPSLREVFVDPNTNELWNAGDKIKRPALADTLETIANDGAETVYSMGKVGRQLLDDIKEFGGILTEEDFAEYKVKWMKPVEATLKDGEHLYSMPLSGSGPLLIFIMNLLKEYDFKHDTLSYHRIMEAFKIAFGRRSDLADPDFAEGVKELVQNLTSYEFAQEMRKKIDDEKTSNDISFYGGNFGAPEDHGTAHISVLAPNGDAISITGTINYVLGSLRRSSKTGIILNDEMDDFSVPGRNNVYGIPPSAVNYVKPGKRPISSMAPSIVVNKNGDAELIVGAAGGSRISTSIAHAIIQYYYFKSRDSLWKILSGKRLHHQLVPNYISFDPGFDPEILKGLEARNHSVKAFTSSFGFGALVGILADRDTVQAAYDPRRGGSSVVF